MLSTRLILTILISTVTVFATFKSEAKKNTYEKHTVKRSLASEENEVTVENETDQDTSDVAPPTRRRANFKVVSECRRIHELDHVVKEASTLTFQERAALKEQRINKCMDVNDLKLILQCSVSFSREGREHCYDFADKFPDHFPNRIRHSRFDFLHYVFCTKGRLCANLETDDFYKTLLPQMDSNPRVNSILQRNAIAIERDQMHGSNRTSEQCKKTPNASQPQYCDRIYRYSHIVEKEYCFSNATVDSVLSCLQEN